MILLYLSRNTDFPLFIISQSKKKESVFLKPFFEKFSLFFEKNQN